MIVNDRRDCQVGNLHIGLLIETTKMLLPECPICVVAVDAQRRHHQAKLEQIPDWVCNEPLLILNCSPKC